MSKSVYLVQVVRKERDGGGEVPDAAQFIEAVRASNRREAKILVSRKYPDHLVLDKVTKAP